MIELPQCVHRVRIKGGMKFCLSPQACGKPHERPPTPLEECYECGFKKDGPPAPSTKPRMTVDQIAKIRFECQEAKRRGLPCPHEAVAPSLGRKHLAAGVTTCSLRVGLVDKTLASLRAAGFDPRPFMDPGRHAFANWVNTAYYLLCTGAKRIAIFQDDILVHPRTLEIVQAVEPPDGYLNCICYPAYQSGHQGWKKSEQRGQGAQALVFSRAHLEKLLLFQPFMSWGFKRHNNIDRLVNMAMNDLGVYEYVHEPSLVSHVEGPSAIGNKKQPPIEIGDLSFYSETLSPALSA